MFIAEPLLLLGPHSPSEGVPQPRPGWGPPAVCQYPLLVEVNPIVQELLLEHRGIMTPLHTGKQILPFTVISIVLHMEFLFLSPSSDVISGPPLFCDTEICTKNRWQQRAQCFGTGSSRARGRACHSSVRRVLVEQAQGRGPNVSKPEVRWGLGQEL